MEYDVRSGSYTFKHKTDAEPAAAHEKFKEHYHTMYELLYFLEGDADFAIQHTLYRLKPHCLLVVKPGELHNLVVKSGKRYERIVLRFGAETYRQHCATGSTASARCTTSGARCSRRRFSASTGIIARSTRTCA